MANSFKPTNYNSLSPYFIVKEAQKFIDLLQHVFGAEELRKYKNSDGSIMHAEMKIDDSILMLGEASEKYPPIQQLVHLYVTDAKEIYDRALVAGCVSVEPPKTQDGDSDIRATFKDFAGNTWSVGTQL